MSEWMIESDRRNVIWLEGVQMSLKLLFDPLNSVWNFCFVIFKNRYTFIQLYVEKFIQAFRE